MKYWQKLSRRIETKKLSWIEKCMLEHAEPVNLMLHIIGGVVLGYGLWINNLNYVLFAILILIAGHLYLRLKK